MKQKLYIVTVPKVRPMESQWAVLAETAREACDKVWQSYGKEAAADCKAECYEVPLRKELVAVNLAEVCADGEIHNTWDL